LTDFDEIWIADAFGLLSPTGQKKIKFTNSRQQKAIILKMKIVIYLFKYPENVV